MTTQFPPWLIIIVALITLYGLRRIDKASHDWRIKVLMLIPIVFTAVYFWVWSLSPPFERISFVVRQGIFYSFGIADFVIFDHVRKLGAK